VTRAYGIAAAVLAAAVVLAAFLFLHRSDPASVSADARRQCLTLAGLPHGGMVWVPPGDFAQGDTVYRDEGPVARVHVDGFWMDSHEVTNGEFARFVRATGYVTQAERPLDPKTHPGLPAAMLAPGALVFVMPKSVDGLEDVSQWWRYVPGADWRHPAGPGSSVAGRDNYPVVAVTHDDALAYARWKHRDLPTEAEWEWAARGGNPKAGDDHDQPKNANTWQGLFPTLNSGDDGFVGLAPAGCYAPNAFGLYDMFGNVWELTDDLYRPRRGETAGPDSVPAAGDAKRYVIKGGSFLCAPNYCMRYRSGSREGQEADLATSHLGFRTVLRVRRDHPP
jgi:formylglycine-generating enzyme